MKNYLKSEFAFFCIFVFTGMHAQIKSGYTIGLNLSTMTMKTSGKILETKALPGIHFGEVFEISINDNFALQSSLIFSAKGSIYKIDTAEYSLSPIYFEAPVISVCRFGSDALKIALFAGVYIAYGIGGKMESGENISFGSGENNDLKPFDIGLNFGAGININGLQVSAQYGLGLTNISTVRSVESVMKNRVIGISVSSLFAGK
jgi:hypothetical protein